MLLKTELIHEINIFYPIYIFRLKNVTLWDSFKEAQTKELYTD